MIRVYIEAYACDEHGDGPGYASFEMNETFVRRIMELEDVCKKHDLTEAREWRVCHWGPGVIADELRLQSDELVVSGGCFWFRATPKHCDYHVETRLVEIDPLLVAFYDWKEGDAPLTFGKYSDDEWAEHLAEEQEEV